MHQFCEDFNTLFSVSVVSIARELMIFHSAGGHTKPPCTRGGNVSGPVHICHWHVSYHTFLRGEMLTAIMIWGSSLFVLHMYQDPCPLSNTHCWVSSISILCHWSLSYSIGLAWRYKFTAPHCNTNHYLVGHVAGGQLAAFLGWVVCVHGTSLRIINTGSRELSKFNYWTFFALLAIKCLRC